MAYTKDESPVKNGNASYPERESVKVKAEEEEEEEEESDVVVFTDNDGNSLPAKRTATLSKLSAPSATANGALTSCIAKAERWGCNKPSLIEGANWKA